jgi:hypothetical protein
MVLWLFLEYPVLNPNIKSISKMPYPEIFIGHLFNIDGEIYELYDMRVTAVESPDDFITSAFFRSKDPKSKNPFFEEAIKRMIGNPLFKRHFEPEK